MGRSGYGNAMNNNSSADEEYEGEWYPYENGATMGQVGSENGYVIRDDELGDPDDSEDADARLTLEQGRVDRPGWRFSATLYGWMFQVHEMPAETPEADALRVFDEMKAALTRLAGLLPYEEDGQRRIEQKAAQLNAGIADFEHQYPSVSLLTHTLDT